MKISKATQAALLYAQKHYSDTVQKGTKYAFNVWGGDKAVWHGVISFGETTFLSAPFDKWRGQVYEMQAALDEMADRTTAILAALDALREEAPHIDLVTSRADVPGVFEYGGKMGDGRQGAYIVKGERLHPKTVKQYGWRQSVLWLREHIDSEATQFDRQAKDIWLYPMTEQMKQRITALEV